MPCGKYISIVSEGAVRSWVSMVTDSGERSILHRGVMGVLTGLTSTLSRYSYVDSLVRRKVTKRT